MNRSLKLKIMIGLLMPVLLIFSFIFILTAINTTNQITRMNINTAFSKIKGLDSTLSTFLNESKRNTETLAADKRIQDPTKILTNYLSSEQATSPGPWAHDFTGQQLFEAYSSWIKIRPEYVDVYIGTSTGSVIVGSNDILPPNWDPRTRIWYKTAVADPQKTIVSPAYISSGNNETMITIARAAIHNKKIVGVVGIDITLKNLTNYLNNIKLGKNGFIILFQNDGTVLANPYDQETNFKNITELDQNAYASIFNYTANEPILLNLNGQQYQAIQYISPDTGWKFAGFIHQDELMAPVKIELKALLITFGIGLLFISVIVVLLLTKIIINPIRQITAFLQKIKNKEYSNRIFSTRKDEIGEIFTELNSMSETLEKNIKEILEKTENAEQQTKQAQKATAQAEAAAKKAETAKSDGMRQAGNELEKMAADIENASIKITHTANSIHQGMNIQKDHVESTAAAMEEMNSTVLEVARNASETASNAQSVKELAIQGAKAVNDSIEAVHLIQNESGTLSQNMENLEKKSEAIGDILNVITDIADQTNLLALNAAIEAARAGEYGRGFAVVADEVRKLAEKTMTATKEVEKSIVSIQEVTHQNVLAMNNSAAELKKATELANTSGEMLQKIVEGTELSADKIQSIAAAAEEQSATSEEINRSLSEINQIATDTETSVEEAQQQINELNNQINEMNKLITNLKNA